MRAQVLAAQEQERLWAAERTSVESELRLHRAQLEQERSRSEQTAVLPALGGRASVDPVATGEEADTDDWSAASYDELYEQQWLDDDSAPQPEGYPDGYGQEPADTATAPMPTVPDADADADSDARAGGTADPGTTQRIELPDDTPTGAGRPLPHGQDG